VRSIKLVISISLICSFKSSDAIKRKTERDRIDLAD
jgi:hypothetical protein